MKTIFLHGLGQTPSSWDGTVGVMGKDADILCPSLFDWLDGREASYPALYHAFSEYCNQFSESLNLCGLSLGGILALQYGIENPDRLNSMALIAAQYTMPRMLLRFQNILFRFVPRAAFQKIGLEKPAFIRLCDSMACLDFENRLDTISCPVLVICGEKDTVNRQASQKLQARLPGAGLRIIKNAGHEVNVDAPEALGRELSAFFHLSAEGAIKGQDG